MKKASLLTRGSFFGLLCFLMLSPGAYGGKKKPAPVQQTRVKAQPTSAPEADDTPAYVVSEAVGEGTIKDDLAKFDIEIKAEALMDGPHRIPIFSTGVSITEVKMDSQFGRKAFLLRDKESVELLLQRKGNYSLNISFVQKVTEGKSGKTLKLPLVPALRTLLTLTIPEKDVEVKATPEISIETSPKADENATQVTIYGGATDEVTLTWLPRAPEKEIAPIVFADQVALMHVGSGVLRIESNIKYSILQGKVGTLQIRLPAGCNLLSVKGEDILSWDIVEGEGARTLKVDLIREIEETYQFRVTLERALAGIPVTFQVPKIEPMNVTREKGFVAVAAAKGLQVEAKEQRDASQVDVKELPPDCGPEMSGVHLAFKYLKRPFDIQLEAKEVEAKVSAEIITVVKTSLDAMRLTSIVQYTIRDAGVFHFKLQLSEGLKLIDVRGENINNWRLEDQQLEIDLRSKAEKSFFLEIETEKPVETAQGASVPTIQALDVARERGYIAISPLRGIKVESAGEPEKINQIDVNELPFGYGPIAQQPQAQQAQQQRIISNVAADQQDAFQRAVERLPVIQRRRGEETAALAYRYILPGYSIRVNISEIQPEVNAEVHTLIVIKEKEMDVHTEIRYDIRKAGVFQLKVSLPPELRLQNVEGKDTDDETRDEASGLLTVNLKGKVEGEYVLTLDMEKTLDDLTQGVVLPVISAEGVDKETGFLGIGTKASVDIEANREDMEGLDDIDINELPVDMTKREQELSLAFKYFSQPWKLSLLVEAIDPRVEAETFSFLALGEGLIEASATVKYGVSHAGVDTFKVKMPDGATNIDVDGANIKLKDYNEEDNVQTVTLQSKVMDEYDLYFTFQMKMKEGKEQPVAYSGVKALPVEREVKEEAGAGADAEAKEAGDERKAEEKGTEGEGKVKAAAPLYLYGIARETGFIAVASRADVEIRLEDNTVKDLTPIDEQEIPSAYKAGITLPILYAFRYLAHPYTLTVHTVLHDPTEVVAAIIEACKLDTIVTEEGHISTDLVCRLRSSRKQYLDLYLPPKAEIRHAFVDNEPVRPLDAKDEKGRLITKIPIAKAGEAQVGFTVWLRYETKRDDGDLGLSGELELECPRTNIDIMRLGWTVALPEGYRLVSDAGTMRRLRGVSDFEQQLRTVSLDISPAARSQRQKSSPSNDSVQSKYNLRAIDNVLQAGNRGEVSGIYTGHKPDLPNKFFFQSLIVPGDEPATIESRYMRTTMGLPLHVALVICVLVVGIGAWRLIRWRDIVKLAMCAAIALFFVGLVTLLESWGGGFLRTMTGTMIFLSFAFAISMLVNAIRSIEPKPPSETPKQEAHPPEPEAPLQEAPLTEEKREGPQLADGESETPTTEAETPNQAPPTRPKAKKKKKKKRSR